MAKDLSKFLMFHKTEEPDMKKVASFKAVECYVEELQKRNIGSSGIIAKLNVLCFAQVYLLNK